MPLPSFTAPSSELWTPKQAAIVLGVSSRTLAGWRSAGSQTLPYVKVGRLIRYRAQDVQAWLQNRLQTATAPHSEACQ